MTRARLVTADDLTTGERLFLLRRRKRTTQAKMAEYYCVSPGTYILWEHDDLDTVTIRPPKVSSLGLPGGLATYEACLIERRRKGMTAYALAERMGCPRHYIELAERGKRPVYRLEAFWLHPPSFRRGADYKERRTH